MNTRIRLVLATALVTALSATGCSQNSGSKGGGERRNPAAANDGKILGGTPEKVGTLTILSNQDFAHWSATRWPRLAPASPSTW